MGETSEIAEKGVQRGVNQKFNIKVRLVKIKIIRSGEVVCIFCGEEEEIIDYFFVYYNYILFVWGECLKW